MGKVLTILLNIILAPYKLFTRKSIFSYLDRESIFQRKVSFKSGCRIHKSKIGEYSYVRENTIIINSEIGKFCSISRSCIIGMSEHPHHFVSTSPYFLIGQRKINRSLKQHPYIENKKTTIGNDVWIGANVLIKAGVTIGSGAIIGAGSVVTHDVPPYAIFCGIPAKLLRYRFETSIIQSLLETKWWDFSKKDIAIFSTFFDSPEEFLKNYYKRGKNENIDY